jgi:DNA polymerase-4
VRDELELDCSVGGATSKFLAKLASKHAKPRVTPDGVRPGPGVVLVPPGGELAFLHPLAVQALWGVGPKTLERLARFGIVTVGDLAGIDLATLTGAVGDANGRHLHDLAWAVDTRPVEPERAIKSIGHEETFAEDLLTHDELRREAVRLADGVATRLRAHGGAARTITVKLKFADFTTITRSRTVPLAVTTAHAILAEAVPLLEAVRLKMGVRLLGISVSNLAPQAEQLSLDLLSGGESGESGTSEQDWVAASDAVDKVRNRFGSAAIGPASSVSADGLRLVRRGAQQWGPDHDAQGP